MCLDSEIYNAWHRQSDFNFGFVPLSNQMLPNIVTVNKARGKSPIQIHEIVRSTSKPNFVQARVQIDSQLNVEVWKKYLVVVDQFKPGYQFTPTLNYLEDL